MATLYAGIGLQLRKGGTAPAVAQPLTYTIPSGSSSVGTPLNAGMNTTLNVLYGTAPAGTAFNIMYDIQQDFSTEYVLQAIPAVAAQKLYTWSTDGLIELSGFIRITNAGGTDITAAYVQQTSAFVG